MTDVRGAKIIVDDPKGIRIGEAYHAPLFLSAVDKDDQFDYRYYELQEEKDQKEVANQTEINPSQEASN